MKKQDLPILINKYADLVVKKGLNFKKNKIVFIEADTDQLDFVNLLVEKCYKFGAKKVNVDLTYRPIVNTCLKYEDKDSLIEVSKYRKEKIKYKQETKAAHIYIESFDPNWVEKGYEDKFLYVDTLLRKNIKKILKGHKHVGPFTIITTPSSLWSTQLFPNLSEEEAILKHWEIIFKCVHISINEDPIKSWGEHAKKVKEKADWLNSLHIKTLHYTNSLGTDLTIGINKDSHYAETEDYDEDEGHRPFYSNIPTEETFISPNKYMTEGIVYSSKPLYLDGVLIDKFNIRFHKGKAIEAHAEVGEKILNDLLKTDKGSCYLGEAALVPFDSPINNTGILFKNILFDENASCHFALGDSYTYTCNNHTKYKKKDFIKMGYNFSSIHVDFMIGTKDLDIVAETYDGKKVVIFKNGRFAK